MGSNLDIFKIGVGPSSSHTLGPNLAALRFLDLIDISKTTSVKIELYGSLSLTGHGHLTDKAVIWGLSNVKPIDLNNAKKAEIQKDVFEDKMLNLGGKKKIPFVYEQNLIFKKEFLPLHENGVKFYAYNGDELIKEATFYSIGGGYIKDEDELKNSAKNSEKSVGFEINSAKDALRICEKENINLAQLALKYEMQFAPKDEIKAYLRQIWQVMQEVYESGLNSTEKVLPGPLKLKRRTHSLKEMVRATYNPLGILDYISLYAIAIAEENASGARVVTAPTNGACAVVPAVMLYLKNHSSYFYDETAVDFLLVCTLIGSLYKKNASISGAEAGCQAEIGSASSMAAAAMATCLGGNALCACSAAETAMEHHLGLTCDPVAGLVQIPCIERNAFGAIKAIMAARMALRRHGKQAVSLDEVITTMYETGKDMNSKYRETSLGGLSKNVHC